jgi:hypothetical protein
MTSSDEISSISSLDELDDLTMTDNRIHDTGSLEEMTLELIDQVAALQVGIRRREADTNKFLQKKVKAHQDQSQALKDQNQALEHQNQMLKDRMRELEDQNQTLKAQVESSEALCTCMEAVNKFHENRIADMKVSYAKLEKVVEDMTAMAKGK